MMLRIILGGLAGMAGLLAMTVLDGEARAADASKSLWVFFGTYTSEGKSKGIYRSELDLSSGKLTPPVLAATTASPSFLAIHPNGKFLYSVGEVDMFEGKKGGIVGAYAIDGKTGALTLLNQQSSGGSGPCHVSVSPLGTVVGVANYGGGSVATYAIGADGKLSPATSFIQHKGKSVLPNQEGPHAHSINFDRTGKFAIVADLGMDMLVSYKVGDKGELTPNVPAGSALPEGSGPRHFAFHPTADYGFVINEMACTITAFKWWAEKGGLVPDTDTKPTIEKRGKGDSTAEVQVHPSGKFVYGSNRGHNTIAIFAFDETTGKLTAAGEQGKGIKTPRNFGIDPTGKFLLVANQDGESVLVFSIDPKTGALTPTENKIDISNPVCVKFLAK